MVTNLIITLAIVLMALAITLMSVRIKVTEESVDKLDFEKYSARMDEIDRDLDRCELRVNGYDEEIEKVVERLNAIADDFERLDAQVQRDHLDLVDIRERYVLYREPVNESVSEQ